MSNGLLRSPWDVPCTIRKSHEWSRDAEGTWCVWCGVLIPAARVGQRGEGSAPPAPPWWAELCEAVTFEEAMERTWGSEFKPLVTPRPEDRGAARALRQRGFQLSGWDPDIYVRVAPRSSWARAGWPSTVRQFVRQRDDGLCRYCGDPGYDCDHVLPKSRGGPDVPSNLVWSCRQCNGDKADRTPDEWFARLRLQQVGRSVWYLARSGWVDRVLSVECRAA